MNQINVPHKWRGALYARISRDDHSNEYSIENQKKRLYDFVENHGDEFQSAELYVDVGASGSNSDRERFICMLNDIKEKKINCVIVKDLSRLSRNYYEAGYYLDFFFSSMDIRFVSLEYPALDSFKSPELMNSVMIPMQNVVNDDFCRQTSIKVRNILKMKREKGEFVGAFAPYGYSKHPKYKHQLIIDDEAAETVRMIFQWFVYDSMSQKHIVKKLNALGILAPAAYKQSIGLAYHNHGLDQGMPLWNLRTVRGILGNQVYIGDMVQGRQRSKSYKHKKVEDIPEDEWVIVKATHSPIIKLDVFLKAKSLLSNRMRAAFEEIPLQPFAGLVRCAECNKAMQRHASSKYIYFRCRTYREQSRNACFGHSFREDRLFNIISTVVQLHTKIAADISEIQQAMQAEPIAHDYEHRIDCLINQKKKQLIKTARYKKSLYQDWKDGMLTKEECEIYRSQYDAEIKAIKESISELNREKNLSPSRKDKENQLFEQFLYGHILPELNHAFLSELIERIDVDQNGDLTIHFNFQDPFFAMVI